MPWHKTSDDSIEDHTGKVLFFSKDRFVADIQAAFTKGIALHCAGLL